MYVTSECNDDEGVKETKSSMGKGMEHGTRNHNESTNLQTREARHEKKGLHRAGNKSRKKKKSMKKGRKKRSRNKKGKANEINETRRKALPEVS